MWLVYRDDRPYMQSKRRRWRSISEEVVNICLIYQTLICNDGTIISGRRKNMGPYVE